MKMTILSVAMAMTLSAAVVHLNAGESISGQETMNGETWNNLSGFSSIGSLQYSDGTNATGITATQAVIDSGGNNPNDSNGVGYITGLDSMSTSLLFANANDTQNTVTLTISGLTVGSLWNVDIYAGLSSAAPPYDFAVNGGTVVTADRNDIYNSGAPLTFASVAANSSGEIVIAVGPGPDGSTTKILQGATLTLVPEPSSSVLALLGLGLAWCRRRTV